MLTSRLAEQGWESVICVSQEPSQEVRRFLDAPYLHWEVIPDIDTNRLAAMLAYAKLLLHYRPRWLFMQFTPCLSSYPWLARVLGVEKVLFADQLSRPEGYEPAPTTRWKRWVARSLTSSYSAVVAVSNYNQQALKKHGFVSPRRLHRIYNSVDMARVGLGDGAVFRRQYGIPSERVLVVQTASLIPEKGVDDVLLGAKIALQVNTNLHFAFVGDGFRGSIEHYREVSRNLGIESHVTFTGLVKDPTANGVYAAADICSQMSRWQEAFGWVIAEAMACSRPVIGTRVGAIPEIIDDSINGYLIPSGDSAAFAERVLQLAGDPELRMRLGKAAYAKVEQQFNLQTSVHSLIKLFETA